MNVAEMPSMISHLAQLYRKKRQKTSVKADESDLLKNKKLE